MALFFKQFLRKKKPTNLISFETPITHQYAPENEYLRHKIPVQTGLRLCQQYLGTHRFLVTPYSHCFLELGQYNHSAYCAGHYKIEPPQLTETFAKLNDATTPRAQWNAIAPVVMNTYDRLNNILGAYVNCVADIPTIGELMHKRGATVASYKQIRGIVRGSKSLFAGFKNAIEACKAMQEQSIAA